MNVLAIALKAAIDQRIEEVERLNGLEKKRAKTPCTNKQFGINPSL